MSRQALVAIALFFVLLLVLLVAPEFLNPKDREAILPVAADGLKIVIGALVGAISALAGAGRSSQ
jgi:uncharacterized membrane protein YfcA